MPRAGDTVGVREPYRTLDGRDLHRLTWGVVHDVFGATVLIVTVGTGRRIAKHTRTIHTIIRKPR